MAPPSLGGIRSNLDDGDDDDTLSTSKDKKLVHRDHLPERIVQRRERVKNILDERRRVKAGILPFDVEGDDGADSDGF